MQETLNDVKTERKDEERERAHRSDGQRRKSKKSINEQNPKRQVLRSRDYDPLGRGERVQQREHCKQQYEEVDTVPTR